MNAACAQIAQFLDVPLYNSSGISDSKVPDGRPGAEKGITNLAAALAGSNFIHHSAGFLESLLTVAYEQFVIDNDTNGAVMRMVRGIEVDEKNCRWTSSTTSAWARATTWATPKPLS
jgi:trimethylamine--corrinoid protein Co-methyltransferase